MIGNIEQNTEFIKANFIPEEILFLTVNFIYPNTKYSSKEDCYNRIIKHLSEELSKECHVRANEEIENIITEIEKQARYYEDTNIKELTKDNRSKEPKSTNPFKKVKEVMRGQQKLEAVNELDIRIDFFDKKVNENISDSISNYDFLQICDAIKNIYKLNELKYKIDIKAELLKMDIAISRGAKYNYKEHLEKPNESEQLTLIYKAKHSFAKNLSKENIKNEIKELELGITNVYLQKIEEISSKKTNKISKKINDYVKIYKAGEFPEGYNEEINDFIVSKIQAGELDKDKPPDMRISPIRASYDRIVKNIEASITLDKDKNKKRGSMSFFEKIREFFNNPSWGAFLNVFGIKSNEIEESVNDDTNQKANVEKSETKNVENALKIAIDTEQSIEIKSEEGRNPREDSGDTLREGDSTKRDSSRASRLSESNPFFEGNDVIGTTANVKVQVHRADKKTEVQTENPFGEDFEKDETIEVVPLSRSASIESLRSSTSSLDLTEIDAQPQAQSVESFAESKHNAVSDDPKSAETSAQTSLEEKSKEDKRSVFERGAHRINKRLKEGFGKAVSSDKNNDDAKGRS